MSTNPFFTRYKQTVLCILQSTEELSALREKQIEDQKYERVENVANLVFETDSDTSDNEIVKALDKKYDTLMDKLLLESMKKQMGEYLDRWY